jgi:Tfp pilus assembly protein PilV
MSPSRLSPRGTSLIEAMAALVVFSVGILGVMQMNVLASHQNNLARSQTAASKIARDLADAFERLRFDHPLVAQPTTLAPNDPEFANFDNTNGLVRLEQAASLTGGRRPLLGAADAILNTDGNGTFYQVAWRSQVVANPTSNPPGAMDSRRILIMVRYPTPGGFRQVNVWAVKYSPMDVTSGTTPNLEF